MFDSCAVCGGDGRLQNSFGSEARCPACSGSGRRSDAGGMRDVTKTKPSHHNKTAPVAVKDRGPATPTTGIGATLAQEVGACATLSSDTKARLIREIVDYEATHGSCTQTFSKKIRRQLRPSN